MQTASSVDMLHGPLTGKLIRFALPIAASSMLQQLFNAADTAVAVAGCAAVTVPLTLFRAQAAGFFSADPAGCRPCPASTVCSRFPGSSPRSCCGAGCSGAKKRRSKRSRAGGH